MAQRILCVEDEKFISELYARSLNRAGYEVTIVADGDNGLREALSGAYDVILLDIMLPNMSGVEILQRIRSTENTDKVQGKIIITTNLEQKEDIRAQVEQLADGYLIKAEVTPRELVQCIQQVVGEHPA